MKKIFFLLLLFPLAGMAQVYQVLPQYGYEMKRVNPTLVLQLPTDTVNNKLGIARVGSTLYVGNGTYWTGGSGNYLDSFWRVSGIDSNYYRINGVTYAVLDSTGGGGSGWSLTGNSGTDPDVNFIGTTDNIDVVLKRNNVETIRLLSGAMSVTGNINLTATTSSSTGVIFKGSNRFIHDFALAGTSGDNTFVGTLSGNFSMTGSSGGQGSNNVGVGSATLYSNTTGFKNTAIGAYVLQNNTTGLNNTALGQAALFSNTTGYNNVAVGIRAAAFGSAGHDLVAIGVDAISRNNTGIYTVGIGTDAFYNNWNSSYGVAIGDSTFWLDSTGFKNTAIGSRAGYYLGGNYATLHDSLVTFLGADASRDNSISSAVALNNLTVIGYNAKGFASNQVVLGNDNVTTTLLKGNVGMGTVNPDSLLDVRGGVKLPNLYSSTNATDSMMVVNSTGGVGYRTIPSGGGTPSLTQYRLAVGDASNLLSSNAAITGGRALISDANGVPTHSTVSTTQLQYLSSATGTTGTASTNLVFSTSPTITTPILNMGSDATGDIYYRNSGGAFTRLPIGTSAQGLRVVGGIPAWGDTAVASGSQTPWTSNINAAGYTLNGNSTSGGDLLLSSTSHATKGKIFFGVNSAYDEVNKRFGINITSPAYSLDVNGNINVSDGNGISLSRTGTNRGIVFTNPSDNDNISVLSTYPQSGTNVGNQIFVIPKGTGFSSGIKSTIFAMNTDFVADATNWEGISMQSEGTTYSIKSRKNGTGSYRPIYLDAAGGTTQMILNTDGSTSVNGNLSLATAGNKLKITEGTNGSVGQTALVAGTKAITISGLTTSSRAIVTFVSVGGTVSTTWQYKAVCTSNTLTITAIDNTGTINTLDTSTLNYFIIN